MNCRRPLLLLILLLAACREEDTPAPDASVPTSADAGPGADVARCVELANTFRDNCAESNGAGDERVCLWEGYAELCRTGNTALLLEAMECLDSTTCRAFSDANEGNACLDALHARAQPAPLRDAITAGCAACGGDCAATTGRAEIVPYLPASAAATFRTCSASACSIDAFVDACADEIAPLAAFQCGSGAPPPATADVARCVELATTFRDNCAASNGAGDVRVCLWEGYADLCRTGNTSLLIDAMECLDASQCRTFSDANDGNACLDALHAAQQPAAVRSVIVDKCEACGGTQCATSASRGEIVPYLLPADAAQLATCSGSACSIDGIVEACTAEITPFAAFQCAD